MRTAHTLHRDWRFHAGYGLLKRKLSKRDLKDREEAFKKAKNFIENGNSCNGLDTPISKTFMVKGTKHKRIDIEIISGRIDPNS